MRARSDSTYNGYERSEKSVLTSGTRAPLQLASQVTQEDVFSGTGAMASVKDFVEGIHDTIFLAYGQTGTGKTHTIFGVEKSLKGTHTSPDTDWGVFPRVAFKALAALKSSGLPFSLDISAVEFFNAQCLDLVDSNA